MDIRLIRASQNARLVRGTAVFVKDEVAMPAGPHYDMVPCGVCARDIKKGETIEYNPIRNTEDIIVNSNEI